MHKYVKLLGLAVVAAAALMAFAGAGTASATVLCKTNVIPCGESGWTYGIGTEIHATQEKGETGILEDTEGHVLVTCSESTVLATTLNHGSASETVRAAVTKLTFGGCTGTVDVLTLGELEIHHIEGSGTDGTITAKNTKVTVKITENTLSCVYGAGTGIDIGTLTHSTGPTEPATIDINAVVPKVEGSFVCPPTTRWTAKYLVTSPVPLYIKNV